VNDQPYDLKVSIENYPLGLICEDIYKDIFALRHLFGRQKRMPVHSGTVAFVTLA
jgi:hypothetical protein